MAIQENDDLTFIPPSVFADDVAKMFSQVNGSSQERDNADLAAATNLSQPFNIGGNFGG